MQLSARKPGGVRQSAFKRFAREHGSVLMFAVLFIIAAVFVPNFFTVRNIFTVIKQAAVPLVACMGLMLILTTGGIDLSLGYTLGLCSVLLGMMTKRYGIPAIAAIPVTLLIGTSVGLLNGLIVQYLKVPPFIATLGSGYVLFGIAQIFGKGDAFYQLPKDLIDFGTVRPLSGIYATLPEHIQSNDFVNQLSRLPNYVFIAIAVAIIAFILRHKTTYGRSLSAFGFNRATARLSGINTAKLHVATYMISSTLVALASVLLTIRVDCAQSNLGGSNYTFEIVTAAVVGGTSLAGGVSSVVNCVFGVLVTMMLSNSINLMAVNIYLYQPAMGVIILLAIIAEVYKNRKL
ncbi:MAG: ABC transporter permease [Clostridia bacterium]|nr:ABC transporter permease [Clostridia bacterium]